MLCDICGKKEATIHIEEISEGKSRTVHICGECMSKNPALGGIDISPFNLGEIVNNLKGKIMEHKSFVAPESKKIITCPVCNWSSKELRSTGLLGCPECYKLFGTALMSTINSMHRGVEHRGKNSTLTGMTLMEEMRLQVSALKRELATCVKREDYEQAAMLRDKIIELSEAEKNE